MTPKFRIRKKGDSFTAGPAWSKWWRSQKDDTLFEMAVWKYKSPTEKDELKTKYRKYYFKQCMGMIQEETTHSKDVIHENMKQKFASKIDEKTGFMIIKSVFSHESKMTNEERWKFIEDVRYWASDFLNLIIPDPERVVD
jgi:hypothetical protein